MRKYPNLLIEMCEEDALSWEAVARECLSYMSEYDVKDMATSTFVEEEEEENEDD